VLFLGVGLIMTGHAILTPMLMIIVMMAGDLYAAEGPRLVLNTGL
jgi:H+-transporting ATPase